MTIGGSDEKHTIPNETMQHPLYLLYFLSALANVASAHTLLGPPAPGFTTVFLNNIPKNHPWFTILRCENRPVVQAQLDDITAPLGMVASRRWYHAELASHRLIAHIINRAISL